MTSTTRAPQGAHSRTTVAVLLRSVDRPFVVLASVARLPTAMLPLGILLYVADRTGSFATGGLAVAALSIGGGIGGPLVGIAADRYGQRVAALLASLAQVAALGALLLVEELVLVLLLAALVGTANPQVGAMVRSRWAKVGRGRTDRASFTATAMAWEAVVDESSFVLGPVLVGTVAGLVSPNAALLLTLVIATTTQTGFALHPSALPGSRRAAATGTRVALPRLHVSGLLLAMAAVGLVFGATQTGVAARLAETGQDALTGPVYALMGVGSAISGLLTTRMSLRIALTTRIAVAGVALTGAGLVAAAAPIPWALGGACLLIGLALGPALVSCYALAERSAPEGWGTTMMTALGTANVVGVAAGAAAAGVLVDGVAPAAALLVVSVAGLLVLVGGVGARVTDPGRRTT
ncbi:MAG: MFS transporter [Marmoricola sp.]